MLPWSQLFCKVFSKVLIADSALLDSVYGMWAMGSGETVILQKDDVSIIFKLKIERKQEGKQEKEGRKESIHGFSVNLDNFYFYPTTHSKR